jgi:tetratricopeptide (TPR) repeat protein
VLLFYACATGLFRPLFSSARIFFLERYEDVSFALHPSAQKAYAYGDRHFDALQPQLYDLSRATYFFVEALKLDPKMPLLHHEFARLEFLRGNYSAALLDINIELATNPQPSKSSYYLKGLILGFMGRYDEAAENYKIYVTASPTNWAGANDYAWVLLKAKRYSEAAAVIEKVLKYWPQNAWLWNSYATALYEMGKLQEAHDAAQKAEAAAASLTEADWLQAYPGNDPLAAQAGLSSLKQAIADNMHTIEIAQENAEK